MTRAAWGGVMVLSLAMTGGAAYLLVTQAGPANTAMTLPMKESQPPLPEVPAAPPAANPTIEKKDSPAPAATPEPAKAVESEKKPTRNILFRLPKPKAKSVGIIGDFNDWKRQALKKHPKGWEVTLPLEPGTYKYLYVVDDKRIKDPNNKNTEDGKSVITVKPLAPTK